MKLQPAEDGTGDSADDDDAIDADFEVKETDDDQTAEKDDADDEE